MYRYNLSLLEDNHIVSAIELTRSLFENFHDLRRRGFEGLMNRCLPTKLKTSLELWTGFLGVLCRLVRNGSYLCHKAGGVGILTGIPGLDYGEVGDSNKSDGQDS